MSTNPPILALCLLFWLASAMHADVRDQDGNDLGDPFVVSADDQFLFASVSATADQSSEILVTGGELFSATVRDNATFNMTGGFTDTIVVDGAGASASISGEYLFAKVCEGLLNLSSADQALELIVDGGVANVHYAETFELKSTGGVTNFYGGEIETFSLSGDSFVDFDGDGATGFVSLEGQSHAVFSSGVESLDFDPVGIRVADDATLEIRGTNFRWYDPTFERFIDFSPDLLTSDTDIPNAWLFWSSATGNGLGSGVARFTDLTGNGRVLLVTVPEPTAVSLLLLGSFGFLSRRRKHG